MFWWERGWLEVLDVLVMGMVVIVKGECRIHVFAWIVACVCCDVVVLDVFCV